MGDALTLDKPKINVPLDYRNYERLAKKLAWQFQRWVNARGVLVTLDDALSEVQYTWVLARDNFKPELGYQFSTYFTAAVRNSVGRFVQSRRHESDERVVRLDSQLTSCDDGEGALLYDVIADTATRSPDYAVTRTRALELISKRSPLLKRLLELVQEQPEELREEIGRLQAKLDMERQMSRERQVDVSTTAQFAPNTLTLDLLGRVFGFNWKHQLQLKNQIEEANTYV